MNFYSFHIGDYLSATAHLSLLEHGAYRRLLDVYYVTEAQLPSDVRQVYRLIGARAKEEKEAVDVILEEFFEKTDVGYRHGRCDHEINVCNKNRTNGKRGGRPPKLHNPDETQTKPKNNPNTNPNSNPDETQAESPPLPHYPITPLPINSAHAATDSTATTPTIRGEACARMRKAGLADANPQHPKLLALLDAGMSADELESAATEAVGKKKGFAYALAVAEGRRRDAAGVAPLPGGASQDVIGRFV